MRAMRARQQGRKNGSTTVELDIDRYDKRIFTLPGVLDEYQTDGATVVLNAHPCKADVDYSILGDTLNWRSDRKLRKTDCLIIRYPLNEDALPPFVETVQEPVYSVTWSGPADYTTVDSSDVDSIDVESLDICEGPRCEDTEDADEDVEYLTEGEELPEEEEEMIESGIRVWHRLTNKGPWIVIQPSTLRVRSSQSSGGDENRVNDTFVERAWTVQTDKGIEDFPEVLLTTREPDVEEAKSGCKSLARYVAIGFIVSLVSFGVVNAQWIAHLLGY
jgi:hypothetical protein